MDDLVTLIPAEWQAYLLFAITATTLAMPLLEWIANKTANTWDNALVARLAQMLALVPRVGLGNRQKAGETVARVSRKPPPIPPVAIVLPLLLGCAGTPDSALQNRLQANELRAQVNEAGDTLAQVYGALPFVCAYLGPDSAACLALEDTYRVLVSATDAAHRSIDVIDAVGAGAEQTRAAVERVVSESKALGASVARLGQEATNALGRNRQSAESDRADHEEGPAPASAEGGSEAPASAP